MLKQWKIISWKRNFNEERAHYPKKKAFQRPFESSEIGAHMMMTLAGTNDKLVE